MASSDSHVQQIADVLMMAELRAKNSQHTVTDILLAEILIRLRNEAMGILPDGGKAERQP